MKLYLKRLWSTKRSYILSLAGLFAVLIYMAVVNPHAISPADYGIGVGAAFVLLIFLGPIVYVDVKRVKIRHPRPVFVEPSPWIIGLMWLVIDALLAAVIVGLLSIESLGAGLVRILDADGFVAGVIMMPLILAFVLAPGTLYSVFIHTRFRRIVEYDTAEWHRIRSKR